MTVTANNATSKQNDKSYIYISEKCQIKESTVAVDKLKGKKLVYQGVIEFGFCSIIFPVSKYFGDPIVNLK